ncbi:MAG TPA: type II toxin-antitoxin system prevent-host-death family antitoxin [Stellaceae bacterium]|nr:type II toxin-antitoxin system prevent-host-death family antitoxin [Stellaceae bacterium]
MMEIGAFEAKNTLGGLLDRVSQGEEIIICRRGKPVAKLVPATTAINLTEARAAAANLRALAAELADGTPVTLDEITAWRDTGRR